MAIIHPMRTGGTWLREQLAASTGLPLLCGWAQGIKRDWLRSELYDQLRRPRGIAHNHLVNWDLEMVRFARRAGWTTLMIARDPVSQCVSLHAFMRAHFRCEGITLNDFLLAQSRGEFAWIDWRHWAVPDWWSEIDVIVPYAPRLFPALQERLGIGGRELPPANGTRPEDSSGAPWVTAIDALERSRFFHLYAAAVKEASGVRRQASGA